MNNNDSNSSVNLVRFVWKRKIPLVAVCVVTAVLSYFFSSGLFIKPLYQSTAVIYAPRTNSISKILFNAEGSNDKLDVKSYASEVETEQMMQLLDAREIRDSLIRAYQLADYYGIDMKDKGSRAKLYKTLNKNIDIRRTDLGAISISVKDWDPNRACNMVNDITRLVDTIRNRTDYERAAAACRLLVSQYDSVRREICSLNDSIEECMRHGIFDFNSQSERVMQQYAIAIAQGNTSAIKRLEEEQRKLYTWGPKLLLLRDLQVDNQKYLSFCKREMICARLDMESSMPVKFIVDNPVPADKKCYPKKSVIVAVSTLSMLILTIIVLLIIEKIEERPAGKSEKTVETPGQ